MRSINSHRIAVLNQKIGIILDWPKFIGLSKTYLAWLKKQKSVLKSQCWSVSKFSGPRRTEPNVLVMAKIYFEQKK